jgi:hypothetical protein
MSTTKRQTMGKMNRERELREKRELKQARKEEKKLAAAAAAVIEAEAPVAGPSTKPVSISTDTVSGGPASV